MLYNQLCFYQYIFDVDKVEASLDKTEKGKVIPNLYDQIGCDLCNIYISVGC